MSTKKSETLKFRTTTEKAGMARAKAAKYFKGDLSKWIRFCLDNCPPPTKKK